ncbi:hypothetical protein [Natranaerobius thermophilus]|uniref:Uncharacterized protein n=1 Tax=Natranaerobius thermophilus (strain ATCC BAA-1301 / DSM 18059 / JW/NM-WN-LF) TaxID=457570 RepID=B2A7V4_NATTJ|nr:hypothetical protein [Natranaerobius thermophilus]ACB84402.1 hypothetical protein Nther_0816 [Natranaerobius thermophilus JW/NM-WN-LF]
MKTIIDPDPRNIDRGWLKHSIILYAKLDNEELTSNKDHIPSA